MYHLNVPVFVDKNRKMIKSVEDVVNYYKPYLRDLKKVDVFGDRVHIVGATIYSNTHIDQLILRVEIEKRKSKEFIYNR